MIVQRKEYFRILGHAIIHVDWTHLIFNMITLYFFGEYVEEAMKVIFGYGKLVFILMYVLAAIISSLPSIAKHKNDHWYNSVGASGAVSAILFAGILLNPNMKMIVFPIPIPLPGYILGLGYLIFSHFMSKKNADNINHDAHITGAIFGFLFPLILEPKLFSLFINNLGG
ncbi:MAG: rhomboid family intramembrane serine protease [Chloroflexia bacterium]|nr:rhomboid family intramembrane serine protease [Chloroflexia bacterium]